MHNSRGKKLHTYLAILGVLQGCTDIGIELIGYQFIGQHPPVSVSDVSLPIWPIISCACAKLIIATCWSLCREFWLLTRLGWECWRRGHLWDYFNCLYTIDTYKRHGCAWALLQPWTLSNKLSIQSVVRVGHPLVICEVSFRSPWGAECSKCEKPCRSPIHSIAKVTYWARLRPNTYEERHNASYRGAVNLRLHSYQDSSWAS